MTNFYEQARNSAEAAAHNLVLQAVENELTITSELEQIAQQTGGQLLGLENRLKTVESLARKLFDRVWEEVQKLTDNNQSEAALNDFLAEQVKITNDVIRYTIAFNPTEYVEKLREVMNLLKEKEYETNQIWNAWLAAGTLKDGGYRGINTTISSANGQLFELQYHTQESYNTNKASHILYKEIRLPEITGQRLTQLKKVQIERAGLITTPPKVEEVRSKRRKWKKSFILQQ